jgi:hypothetical protein
MPEGFPGPSPDSDRPEDERWSDYENAPDRVRSAIDEEVARRMNAPENQEYLQTPGAITRDQLEAGIRAGVIDEMAAEETRRRYGWGSDPLHPFEPDRDTSAIDEEVTRRMNSPENLEYLKLPSAVTRDQLEAGIRFQVEEEAGIEEARRLYGFNPDLFPSPEPPSEDPRG